MSETTHESYWEGVERAHREGWIKGDLDVSKSDVYTHRGAGRIGATNGNQLRNVGQNILRAWKRISSPSAPKLLELGAGAGVAAAMMHHLMPGAELHTVGLTPFNPRLPFNKTVVLELIEEGIKEGGLTIDQIALKKAGIPPNERSDQDTLERLWDTQRKTGVKIFDILETPFATQWIGMFPGGCGGLKGHRFQFIHDHYGPNYHYRIPTLEATHLATYKLLGDDGIICSSTQLCIGNIPEVRKDGAIFTDMHGKPLYIDRMYIAMKRENFIPKTLWEEGKKITEYSIKDMLY